MSQILAHREDDYDQLSTVEIVEEFNTLLREAKTTYEENDIVRKESDDRILDLLHYAELHDNLSASDGFRVYQKITAARRERRRSKDENELLEPLMEFIRQNPKLVNDIGTLVGKLRGTKRCIEQRIYKTRTDII